MHNDFKEWMTDFKQLENGERDNIIAKIKKCCYFLKNQPQNQQI